MRNTIKEQKTMLSREEYEINCSWKMAKLTKDMCDAIGKVDIV